MLGQTLMFAQQLGVQQTNFPIDLSNYSSGMYLVSVRVGDKVHVEKLILTD